MNWRNILRFVIHKMRTKDNVSSTTLLVWRLVLLTIIIGLVILMYGHR